MAGEWIKLEKATPDKPEVMRMARKLDIERDAVFGKLVKVWIWFDMNSVDGVVGGAVDADVDALVSHDDFANAMRHVGWLADAKTGTGLMLPNFARHNGETAKKRALKNDRQTRWRQKHDSTPTTVSSTQASTREEKRREEVPLTPASAGVAKPPVPPCPHIEIIKLYHEHLPTAQQVNPELWNGTRATHLQARWREKAERQDLRWWKKFFTYISDSDFLCGRTEPRPGKTPFVLTLGWIVKPDSFAKIHEGFYNRERR